MKNEIRQERNRSLARWDNDKYNKFSQYLKYLYSLSKEDLEILKWFKSWLRENAEMICEEYKERVYDLLFWQLCFVDFMEFLDSKISIIDEWDEKKKRSWLSWWMWRLAITDWDEDKSRDLPFFMKEVNKINSLFYKKGL